MKRNHNNEKSDKGVAVLEVSMSIACLFLILFAGSDLVVSSLRFLSVSYATSKAARFATTKKTLQGQPNALASLREYLRLEAATYGVNIPPEDIRICPTIYCDEQFPDSLGVSGDLVKVSVDVPFKISAIGFNTIHNVSFIFRNEGALTNYYQTCTKYENGQEKPC